MGSGSWQDHDGVGAQGTASLLKRKSKIGKNVFRVPDPFQVITRRAHLNPVFYGAAPPPAPENPLPRKTGKRRT